MSTNPQIPPPPPTSGQSGLSDNAAGAIAYLTIVPAIIFLLIEPYNKNSFVRFHSFQCLFLCGVAIVVDIGFGIVLAIATMVFPMMFLGAFLWPLLMLFWFGVVILCIIKASQGSRFSLPLIGPLAAKQAGA
ncbi:MAG: hypothetical protein WBE38_01455 [Terracidiphilus sp.]